MNNFVVCRLWVNFGYDSTVIFIMLDEEDKKSFEDDILNMNVPCKSLGDGDDINTAVDNLKKIVGQRAVDIKGVEFKYTPISEFKFWGDSDPSRWYDGDGILNLKTNVYNWYHLEGL